MKIDLWTALRQGATPRQIRALTQAQADGWEIDTHSTFLSRESFEHKLVWNLRLFKPKRVTLLHVYKEVMRTHYEPQLITFFNKEV